MKKPVDHFNTGMWTSPWQQVKSLWNISTSRIRPDYSLEVFGDVASQFFGVGALESRKLVYKWATDPETRPITDGHWLHSELLCDQDFLESCPKGSLGHGYMEFMKFWKPIYAKEGVEGKYGKPWYSARHFANISHNQVKEHEQSRFSPDLSKHLGKKELNYYLTNPKVHPQLKEDVENLGMSKALRIRVGDRLMGLHDMYHILLNYGRDQLGEMLILCWNAVHSGYTGLYAITWLTCLRESVKHRTWEPFRMRREAINHAKKSKNLLEIDFESALQTDLPKLRRKLGIKMTKSYQKFTGVRHFNTFPSKKYKTERWEQGNRLYQCSQER